MAYIGNEWLIIDATNDVVTNDYTDSLYASPSFLSFSENGNIYVVKNNSGVYLAGVNYGQAGAASAAQVTIQKSPALCKKGRGYAGCQSKPCLRRMVLCRGDA